MERIISVVLDINEKACYQYLCNQFDDIVLNAEILENGEIKDISQCDIIIKGKKQDDTFIIQNTDITVINNKITVPLEKDFTRINGFTKIQISLISNNKQISTFYFILKVEKSVIQGTTESKNIITTLEYLDKKIIEVKDMADLLAQFEGLDLTELENTLGVATTIKSDLDASISNAEKINVDLQGITDLKNGLDSSIELANTTKTDLDSSISNSNTSKTNLDNSIASANTIKNNLDNSISSADITKTNLDNSISSASTSKTNLDNIISSANTIKTDLNNVISSANTTKTNLDNTISSADSKNETLNNTIASADSKNGTLNNTIASADSKNETLNNAIESATTMKTNLDNSISSASETKTELETSVNSATTINGTLNNTIASANTTKTNLDNSIGEGNNLKTELEEIIASGGIPSGGGGEPLNATNKLNDSAFTDLSKWKYNTSYGTVNSADNVATIMSSELTSFELYQYVSGMVKDHIYYLGEFIKAPNTSGSINSNRIFITFSNPSYKKGYLETFGEYEWISLRETYDGNRQTVYLFDLDSGGSVYTEETIYIKQPILLDLTEIYGVGNEPSQSWLDEYFKQVKAPLTEFDITEKNKFAIATTNRLKDKLSATYNGSSNWIYPTLLNSFTTTSDRDYKFGYKIDKFGVVHLRGRINTGTSTTTKETKFCEFPEYAKFIARYIPVTTYKNEHLTLYIGYKSMNIIGDYDGTNWIYFDGVKFELDNKTNF